jgi:formylglycine-generating enzyme required for sulfatase activity
MELGGQNRLVPVDAQLAHERDVERQTIPLETVLQAMAGARSKLVLLDACRNNPLASRMVRLTPLARGEGAGGLTEVRQVSRGTVIVFAAAPGQTAADGDGVNSPFTAALLQNLAKPGEDVRVVLGDVSDAVERSTGGRQQPWINFTGLSGRLSLRPGPAPPVPAPPQPAAVLPPPAPGPTPPAPQPVSATGYPVGVGRVFRDCGDCPEMVVIPAGRFVMGSPASEAGRQAGEGPQHEVVVRSPLAVARFEVTFAEWDACVAANGCGERPMDQGWGRGRQPVINVSWEDAQQYVRWLSGRTGRRYRLLTEAEWEYAARAGTTTAYSFGPTISPGQANYNAGGLNRTQPVGSYAANAWGLHDMHGNVIEWVEDCYVGSYAGASRDASQPVTSVGCELRVLRGGSWGNSPPGLRSAIRNGSAPGIWGFDNGLGFRFARTPGG